MIYFAVVDYAPLSRDYNSVVPMAGILAAQKSTDVVEFRSHLGNASDIIRMSLSTTRPPVCRRQERAVVVR